MEQLPLTELAPWLSNDSYDWIHEDDRKRAEFQHELEAETTPLCLFGAEEEDATVVVVPPPRVQTWRSSTTQPDGVGGYYIPSPPSETNDDDDDDTGPPGPGASAEQSSNNNSIAAPSSFSSSIAIEFILSESYEGFGETLWVRRIILYKTVYKTRYKHRAYNDGADLPNNILHVRLTSLAFLPLLLNNYTRHPLDTSRMCWPIRSVVPRY